MYRLENNLLLDRRRQGVLDRPGDLMNYTETDPANAAIDAMPINRDAEDLHTPAESSEARSAITRRFTRCAIAALLSIVILLSWQIYAYSQIIGVMQRALDQQNILLDNAMETHMPSSFQVVPPKVYNEMMVSPVNTGENGSQAAGRGDFGVGSRGAQVMLRQANRRAIGIVDD